MGVKILKFFDPDADPEVFLNPGSGNETIRIRDKKMNSGSATLTDGRYYLSDKIGVLVQAAGLGIKDHHSPTPSPSSLR